MVLRNEAKVALLVLLLAALALLPAVDVRAAAPQPQPVDSAAIAAVQSLAAAPLPPDAPQWTAARVPQQLIDGFESAPWPDRNTWVYVTDLTGSAAPVHEWGSRDCRAADGSRSMWGVGGGADGSALPCGSDAPDGEATAALLWLDLGHVRTVESLSLAFDVWADAEPNEGLFINYMYFDPTGNPVQRRTVYSATGRVQDWARGVHLDLTDLRDRLDPAWRFDARGQHLYLEFVFLSVNNGVDGEGIHIDNLSLVLEEPPPIIIPPDTPTPPPTVDRTVACDGGPDCGTLSISAFVDSRCDGRYQGGLDSKVTSGPYVGIVAGSELLGTTLSRSGSAYFRLPFMGGVTATFEIPDGYEMCSNSENPAVLTSSDFAPFGRAKLDFRIVRKH
jgi:hypothetical protein